MPNAAKRGDVTRVRELLKKGIPPDNVDADGYSPMFWAAFNGHLDVVEVLIGSGAKLSFAGNSDGTPMHAAAMECSPAVIAVLAKNGAEVDTLNGAGLTSLWLASRYGHTNCVRMLLNCGATANTPGERSSALHPAALFGHKDIVKALLDRGANVNSLDQHKLTPLLSAVASDRFEIVQILLEYGADMNAQDKRGNDAIAYSYLHQAKNAERVLLAHKAKLGQEN